MTQAEPTLACIGLGSNLASDRGESSDHVELAIAELAGIPGTRLVARSTIHTTEPVGVTDQPRFANACAMLDTERTPRELLAALLDIERSFGRDRPSEQRWGPRVLDLDLLLHGDSVIDEPGLTLPHPRMHERAFVLAPLNEIAPNLAVPGIGASVRDLLARLG